MIVLMGGSGSTGSSLLKNILNRHPAIFAGEETNLFCKKPLYTDFKANKQKINARGIKGLRNHGWHIYNGIDIFTKEYNFGKTELDQFLDRSNSFTTFCNLLEWHLTQDKTSKIWLEKTPANACNFGDFVDHFPKGKIIHIVRNPLDTIASLVNRGYSLYYAVGIYLINTASGLAHKNKAHCCTIKYEDLVLQPVQTLKGICSFLHIPFYDYILQSQNEQIDVSQLEGWKYDETKAIKGGSVGRFNSLTDSEKNKIKAFASSIEISNQGQNKYNVKHKDIESVAKALSYPWDQHDSKGYKMELFSSKSKDRIKRINRGYATGFSYPIKIK